MTINEIYEDAFKDVEIGKELTRRDVINIIQAKHSVDDGSILPSDVCYNSSNAGVRSCASPWNKKFFVKIRRGLYRYVGPNYDDSKDNPYEFGTIPSDVKSCKEEKSPRTSNVKVNPAKMEQTMMKEVSTGATSFNSDAIALIDDFLKKKGICNIKNETNAVLERARGKKFSLSDHIRAMVYSLLTNQRKWSDVEPKLNDIDRLFFMYDPNEIKKHDGAYFEKGVRNLRCGNISIKKQMNGINHDIAVFEAIEKKNGSMDDFVTSCTPEKVVKLLSSSNSAYKIECMGVALAWEYLRNVGIDGGKPDLHLRRFFGANRIGASALDDATEMEVISIINKIAAEGRYNRFEIDYLIWCYCSQSRAGICDANPSCGECVIRNLCKHHT